MNSNIINTLEKAGIKPTPVRMLVLEQMLVQQKSLSLTEIENLLYPADRTTIYRTLHTFVKSGIAHLIETAGTIPVYALCPEGCTHGTHIDSHPHFVCEICGQITCCTDFIFSLRQKSDSPHYEIHKTEMTLRGICPLCSKNRPPQ